MRRPTRRFPLRARFARVTQGRGDRERSPWLLQPLTEEQGQFWDLGVLLAHSGIGALIGAVMGLMRGGFIAVMTGWTVRGVCWGASIGGVLGGTLGTGFYFLNRSRWDAVILAAFLLGLGALIGALIGFEGPTTPWRVRWAWGGASIGGAIGGVLGGTLSIMLASLSPATPLAFALYGFLVGPPLGGMLGALVGGVGALTASVGKAVWPAVSAAWRQSSLSQYRESLGRVVRMVAIGAGLGLLLWAVSDLLAVRTRYISAVPAPNAMVPEGATTVTLTFSAALDPRSTASVMATGRDGGRQVSITAGVDSGDPHRRTLVVHLRPGLPKGVYRLDWATMASSGKVMEGAFDVGIGTPVVPARKPPYAEQDRHWRRHDATLLGGVVLVVLGVVVPRVRRRGAQA